MTKIIAEVLEPNNIPGAVAALVVGGRDVGAAIVESRDVELGMSLDITYPYPFFNFDYSISIFHWQRGHWQTSWESCSVSLWKVSSGIGRE